MQSPRDTASFDRDALLANVDNDLTLLSEMAELLVEDTPRLLTKLRDGLSDEDPEAMWKVAHAIKGAVSNFAAGPARSLAEAIEIQGRSGALAGIGSRVQELEQEMERLLRDLREFVD